MRRFYAAPDAFGDGKIILNADETRHLRDVLRLRAGAPARVFDGAGREFETVVEEIGKTATRLAVVRETAPAAPESPLELTLGVALLKGEKFELVVQKAVELGVTTLAPLATRRADVRLKDPEKRGARWEKIVLEASKQCGRARLMRLAALATLGDFLGATDSDGERLFFTERGGGPLAAVRPAEKITAVVGSEGGWEDSEIALAESCGFRPVTLGGRILRAETAAVAVAAVLQSRFGDLR